MKEVRDYHAAMLRKFPQGKTWQYIQAGEMNYPIEGALVLGVSEAIYLSDPGRILFQNFFYWDRPVWKWLPDSTVAGFTIFTNAIDSYDQLVWLINDKTFKITE